jgi:MtN3 and saliva related transmembrane protein
MHLIGYVAAILTVAAFVPQVYQAIKTRKTRDLSLPTYATLIVTGTLWSIYGFGLHSPTIYLTNMTVGCLALIICIMKIIEG